MIDYVGENSLTQLITEIKGKMPTDIPKRWYGECTTAQNTQQKVVTIDGFTADDLVKGVVVVVKFTYSSHPTNYNSLNISGTGAKTIKKYGTTDSGGAWVGGSVITIVYDGNYWQMCDYQQNTDANVKQTPNNNTNANYPVLFKGDTSTQEKTQGTQFNDKVTINPSTGTILAKNVFADNLYTQSDIDIMNEGYEQRIAYVEVNLPLKQSALSTAQLNACDSGITADKVATYDGYADGVVKYKDYTVAVTSGIARIVAVTTHNNMVTIVPRGAVKTSAYIFYENVNGVPTWSARVIDPTTGNNVANRNQTFRVFYL